VSKSGAPVLSFTTTIIRRIVFAFIIAAMSIAAGQEPRAAPRSPSQPGPADPQANPMLDSIPPALFQEMFQDHHLVGSPGLAWIKQEVITVAFNGGGDDLYQLIEQTANEWTALGGQLSFSFKDDAGRYRHWAPDDRFPAADIRISFNSTGYWSLLGALAKNVRPGESTMNFARFPDDLKQYFHGQNTDEWRISYAHTTVLHEFGHAIGLSHEHFHPQCQKDLKMDTIIKFLMGPPNRWRQEQARFNMDAQYYAKILDQQAGPLESRLINSPTIDRSSVMLYVLPVSYYKSGDASACKPIGDHAQAWPTTLSEGDKQFYLAAYENIGSPYQPGSPAQEKQR